MWFKKFFVSLGLMVLIASTGTFNNTMAHDIDIYINNGATSTNAEPLLMFTIDLRPSVINANGCSGYDQADANTNCWILYNEPTAWDTDGKPTAGTVLADAWMKDALGANILAANANQLDVYRSTLIKVLQEQIIDVQDKAIKIGLMLPHDHTANCVGPQAVGTTTNIAAPNENYTDAPASTERCSNGAYVRFPFKLIDDSTAGKANFVEFTQVLRSISTDREPKYQGSEMLFEFFRYLQGYRVWNGFNGWNDLDRAAGDDGTERNINDPADSINTGETIDVNGWLTGPTATYSDTTQYVDFSANTGAGVAGRAEYSWPMEIQMDIDGTTPLLDSNGNIVYDYRTYVPDSDVFEDKENNANKYDWYYKTPILNDCAQIFTLNFIFGALNQDSDSDTEIQKDDDSTNMGMGISNLPNSADDRFEAVLSRLYGIDLSGSGFSQNVASYIFTPGPTFKQHQWQQAGSGGGIQSAFDITDPDDFAAQFEDIISSILSISTTFVAPSVAVNVYNRSQVENDIFIAMFNAPDPLTPLWPGNVKKLNLNEASDGTITLVDVNGDNAVDPNQGRISKDALTFWTDRDNLPAPADPTTEDEYAVGKDGRKVDRGGTGSRIPGYQLLCDNSDYTDDTSCTPGSYSVGLTNPSGDTTATGKRKLFTEPASFANDGTATTMLGLEATTSVASELETDLGATSVGDCGTSDADNTSACNLIKYIRGTSNDATDSESDGTKNRLWMMGDALHSRPITMNYGAANGYSSSKPDIRIIVGTNDGLLRMIRNKTTGGAEEGVETWAFMPREVMGIVQELKTGVSTEQHPFGVDGEPVLYVIDNDADGNIETPDQDSDNDKVYLYFGLRRGGKAYYGMDITDPDDPKLIWKIAKTSGGDFDELGQSWSTPRVKSMVYGGSSTPAPVLIFAGGYDTNKDDHDSGGSSHSATAGGTDSEGNAIYIVNALTGALIWKAVYDSGAATPTYSSADKAYQRNDMLDSIPSNVTAADSNGNDLPDRIYVGDTGGVLWRIDMLSNDEADWVVNPILSVGRRMSNTSPSLPEDDRRFFYAPDYVQAKDSTTGESFDAVIIGTGDRTEPLEFDTQEWFYVLRDRDLVSGTLTNFVSNGTIEHYDTIAVQGRELADITDNCLQDGSCGTTPTLTNGWKLKLDCPQSASRTFASSDCGEKNLSPSFAIGGTIFMTSYIPPDTNSTNCGPEEGSGLLYELSLNDGTAVKDNDGDGNIDADDRFTNLRSGGIPAEVVSLGGDKILAPDLTVIEPDVKGGFRTYWYESDIE